MPDLANRQMPWAGAAGRAASLAIAAAGELAISYGVTLVRGRRDFVAAMCASRQVDKRGNGADSLSATKTAI